MGLPKHIPSGGDGLDTFSAPAVKPPQQQQPVRGEEPREVPRSKTQPRAQRRPQRAEPQSSDQPSAQKLPSERLPHFVSEEDRARYEAFQEWERKNAAGAIERTPKRATEETVTSPRARRKDASSAQQTAPAERPNAVRGKRVATPAPAVDPNAMDLEEDSERLDDEDWVVDPKTGKRYLALPSTPKEAIAAYKKSNGKGLDKRQMLAFIETKESFNIDDLNGTAETFMAHLRVPPSGEERDEILRRKAAIAKEQKAEREALDRQIDAKEGALEEPEESPFEQQKPKRGGLFSKKSRKN